MAPAKDLAAGYAGLSDDEDEGEEAVLATPSGTGLPSRGSGVFSGGADMAQQVPFHRAPQVFSSSLR